MDLRAKTARSKGAVGANAITPRVVLGLGRQGAWFDENAKVLDFGCGKDALHVELFKSEGWNCKGVDLSREEKYAGEKFDVVYASNVLNVQASAQDLDNTLESIIGYMMPTNEATFVANYPTSPRKMGLTVADMRRVLEGKFVHVFRVDRQMAGSNAVFMCSIPWNRNHKVRG
jgi:SAM-dependent methyltransferase